MTGDGVNDAPALQRADVGVAVQGATDAARAAADIVLTKPGLSTIVTAIVVARIVFGRMTSFITYRIAATLQLLVFFFIAVLTLHPEQFQPEGAEVDWPPFFHMPVRVGALALTPRWGGRGWVDGWKKNEARGEARRRRAGFSIPYTHTPHTQVLMLMLITLLNDGTLISIGYDNVVPNQTPDKCVRPTSQAPPSQSKIAPPLPTEPHKNPPPPNQPFTPLNRKPNQPHTKPQVEPPRALHGLRCAGRRGLRLLPLPPLHRPRLVEPFRRVGHDGAGRPELRADHLHGLPQGLHLRLPHALQVRPALPACLPA
jgi:hypothetical protein